MNLLKLFFSLWVEPLYEPLPPKEKEQIDNSVALEFDLNDQSETEEELSTTTETTSITESQMSWEERRMVRSLTLLTEQKPIIGSQKLR